jgi:hypothetical protein
MKSFIAWVKASAKSIVSVVGALLAVFVTALSDNQITAVEWWGIAVALATAVATYWVSNDVRTYAKAVVTFLGSISAVVVTSLADGHVDSAEWYGILVAVAAALAVYRVPNDPAIPPAP